MIYEDILLPLLRLAVISEREMLIFPRLAHPPRLGYFQFTLFYFSREIKYEMESSNHGRVADMTGLRLANIKQLSTLLCSLLILTIATL